MELWGHARQLREAKGLSQAAVARRIGTSQSWVARMESGLVDPGLGSVSRYLQAIGARLELRPASEAADFSPTTLAELARRARRHVTHPETMLRMCLQFIDDFMDAAPESRAALLQTPPRSTGDGRWDAFLAALAEHLAFHHQLPIPRWTGRKGTVLRRWWFLSDLPSVKAAALAESPAAFRRRGIFITDDLFVRA
jgi:transcriptional regulator with XRE-family HTH domain